MCVVRCVLTLKVDHWMFSHQKPLLYHNLVNGAFDVAWACMGMYRLVNDVCDDVCVRVCVHGMCAVRMRALCEGWMMSGRYSCMRGNNCVVWVR